MMQLSGQEGNQDTPLQSSVYRSCRHLETGRCLKCTPLEQSCILIPWQQHSQALKEQPEHS